MSEADRIDAEFKERLPERKSFCRVCRREDVCKGVPPGWFILRCIPGGEGPRAGGLFCSLQCLGTIVRELESRA